MGISDALGISRERLEYWAPAPMEFVMVQRPLRRVLAFAGHSIDEVCTNPIVKRKVFCYYKLYKQVNRSIEVTELERQWNR